MPDPETDPFAALAVDLAADHKEEKRKRRMARPSFEAASIETPGFLKKEKPEIPDNAVISEIAPARPNRGCAWHNPTDGKTRYWHGTAWYLSPPAAEAAESEEGTEVASDIAETVAALDGPLPDETEGEFMQNEGKSKPIPYWTEDEDPFFDADEPEESETVTTEIAEVETEIAETTTEPATWGPDSAEFVGEKKPKDPEHGDKWWKGDGEMRWFWGHDETGAEKNRWFQRPPVDSPDHAPFYADVATKAPAATGKENLQVEPAPEPAPKPKATPKVAYEEPQYADEPEVEFRIPDDDLIAFEPAYDFDTNSLVCDVRDAMLEQFKHRQKPWGKLSQEEQRDMVAALENNAEAMVRGVLEKLAVQDEGAIRCLLESYQEKDGIKIVMKLQAFGVDESEKAILFLHRCRGKTVMVRMADAGDYHGHIDAETMPDQPEIDWGAQVTDSYGGDNSDLAGED